MGAAMRSGGITLLYQPLDGSLPHALFNPARETIVDFGLVALGQAAGGGTCEVEAPMWC